METAKKAAALAALASKEAAAAAKEQEAASKEELAAACTEELAAAKQAEGKEFHEEVAAGADDTECEDEGDDGMTSLEYIKTYKCLTPHEVELIIQRPLDRTPFADSYAFKALSADPDATQEDFDLAYEEHEEDQDIRIQFRERVRSEYKANGYVTVSDEYVAMRVRNEELSERLWAEAFADFDDDEVAGFDNDVDVEKVAH